MNAPLAQIHPHADDADLVRGIRQGNRVSFEQMIRKYNRRLYRLARATLRNDAEAEDALQEAYLQAYRSFEQFREASALGTWLSRLVLNECLGRLRRSSRRQNVVPMISADSETEVTERVMDEAIEKPETAMSRAQMRELIERHLDQIPEAFRIVFIMRSVEEMSAEETAACLNLPVATVRTRHFRARSLLREALAKELDLAERDVFDIGGSRCDKIVHAVMSRLPPDSPAR